MTEEKEDKSSVWKHSETNQLYIVPKSIPKNDLSLFGYVRNKNEEEDGSTASDFSDSDDDDVYSSIGTPINYRDSIAIQPDDLSSLLGVEEKKKSKMEALFAKRHNSVTSNSSDGPGFFQKKNQNNLLSAVRNQLSQIESDEINGVKALLLCVNSPFLHDGHSDLEIMSQEDQVKEYFEVISHGFKLSNTKIKDFEKYWEEVKNYDPLLSLEQQQKLLKDNNHPFFYKHNVKGDLKEFLEEESKRLLEDVKHIKKEFHSQSDFKANLNVSLTKVNFGEADKFLTPKREYTYSVKVENTTLSSKVLIVDPEMSFLEWKSPLSFETTKKDASIFISLKYKTMFGKKSAFELQMKLSELMTQFSKPDANWGKKTFTLTLPISERDLPIGNATLVFKLKYRKKYKGKEQLLTLDSHKIYSIIIKNFILSRSKRKTNLTVFTQFEKSLLDEFTRQNYISEPYKIGSLLLNILDCKHKKLIMTFSDVILDGLNKLSNYEKNNEILTKIEASMKSNAFNLSKQRSEEYLGFYLQHFTIKKHNSSTIELEKFVSIFKIFYKEKIDFFEKVIKKTVDSDFSLIIEELTESKSEENENITAFQLYQICETMKQHMVKNDVTILFPKEEDDYSTEVVERYYELFTEKLNEFINNGEKEHDIFNLLKLCESIVTLHQSISTFMNAKQKEFKIQFNPFEIANKYANDWIEEMKQKSNSIVQDSIAVDFFSPLEGSKYSTSFVDIFRSFYEICSLIEHLKFEDQNVINSISTIICQASIEYTQSITEIALKKQNEDDEEYQREEQEQNEEENDSIPKSKSNGYLTFGESKYLTKDFIVIMNNIVSARKQLLCLLDQILENDKERKEIEELKERKYSNSEIIDQALAEDYFDNSLIFHSLISPYLKLISRNIDELSNYIVSIFEIPLNKFIENFKKLDTTNHSTVESIVQNFNEILQKELFDVILTPNIKILNEQFYGTLVIIIVKKIYKLIIECLTDLFLDEMKKEVKNDYLVSMITKLLNTLIPYFDPPTSGVTIIPKEWMNWKSKDLIDLLKQSAGDSKKIDFLSIQKMNTEKKLQEKKSTEQHRSFSRKNSEHKDGNQQSEGDQTKSLFTKFGIGQDERLIDRFACIHDKVSGFCYVFTEYVCFSNMFNSDLFVIHLLDIMSIEKSKKGIKLRLRSGQSIYFLGIANRTQAFITISQQHTYIRRRSTNSIINKSDAPRSKDAKRYINLFGLEDTENLVKCIGCMKERTPGTLYIGTVHLCFDSLNRAQKNTLKIPLSSILIIQQKQTLIKLKQHLILTLFTNNMECEEIVLVFTPSNGKSTVKTIVSEASKLGRVIKSDVKCVFGVSLNEVPKYKETSIPLPLVRIVDRVESSIESQGLYRESGSSKIVQQLRKLYDRGDDPDLMNYHINACCSLLNEYFLTLPKGHSLIPLDLYKSFMKLSDFKKEQDQVKELKKLTELLPLINHDTLGFLIQHLCKINDNSQFNSMNEKNLGIVFAPIFFHGCMQSTVWKEVQLQQDIILLYMKFRKDLFPEEVVKEKVQVSFKV
eukprot:gene10794-3411_t